jgi:hypothetical protein
MAYGQPRRLNAVSVTLLILGVLAAYWFWRFFPFYFDAWSVDHILREAAAQTYHANRLGDTQRMDQLKQLVDTARKNIIKQVGIHDPDLLVDLNVDGDKALITADYSVTVTHPGVTYVTHLHFHREATANIKFVKWD